MEVKKETIELFIKLDRLYDQRLAIFGYQDRSDNSFNIRLLEQELAEHCDKIYQEPFFRIYALYKLQVSEEWHSLY